MRHDFSAVNETETDLRLVPAGRYLCRVRSVRVRRSRDGAHIQWGVCLDLATGEHAGHLATWDNITFSERGLPRVKLMLRALDVDVSGVVEIEPEELEGRHVVCDLEEESYTDPHSGHITLRLSVPYAGYSHPATWEGTDSGDGLGLDDTPVGAGGSAGGDSAAGGSAGGGPGAAAAGPEPSPF